MTKTIDLLGALKERIRKEVMVELPKRIFGNGDRQPAKRETPQPETRKPPQAADRLRCADCGTQFTRLAAYLSHRRWAHGARTHQR